MKNSKNPQSFLYVSAFISTFAAILVHGYLAFRHFEVALGTPSESLCNINQQFNCDAVSASSYSSFLGIPLALWGIMANIVLLLLALSLRWTWQGESSPLSRWLARLSLITVLASVVMAIISLTQMNVYCLFCMIAYVLSFISFAGFASLDMQGLTNNLASDIKELFAENKAILVMLLAVPAGAWMFNGMMHSRYNPSGADYEKMARYEVHAWRTATVHDFSQTPHISFGADADKAKMTITEFADFLCGHCKSAAPRIHAFVKANSDVRLQFINFPLDGACNKAMPRSVGVRCQLAKMTMCGEDKAFKVHDYIFANTNSWGSMNSIESHLPEAAEELGLDLEKWKTCIASEETHRKVAQQADKGIEAGVQGTPAIYVNGKKLGGGQMLPVLQKAYSEL